MTLKANILAALESSRQAALSGQALAAQFGVSRNAVWKAVNLLREDGYEIESTPNRGYRLSPDSDLISETGLRNALSLSGIPLFLHKTLDSTNNEAKRLMTDGVTEPFLVLSDEQTAGRGRHGHVFYSPRQTGLYMTVALAPQRAIQNALGITAYAAVCVTEAVRILTGRVPLIRWVNDLFLDGRKIGGILTEAVTDCESGTVESLLVGVGLNLRTAEVPPEWRDVIGFLNAGYPVKNRLAAEITNRLLCFDPADTAYLEAYRARSMTLGRQVTCNVGAEHFTGLAQDINADGSLVVRTADGVRALRSGVVRTLAE